MVVAVPLAPQTMAVAICGTALCVGGVAYLLHALLYDRKSLRQLAQLASSFSSASSSSVKPPPKRTPAAEYTDVFPPSRRSVLAEMLPPAADGFAPCDLAATPKPLLPITSDYRKADPSRYIFSGFTVGDVKALGDFPDYAKLSGVPLPSPLKNFNVDEAKPRPYRPFRWNYHQTMAYYKMDVDYWLEIESTYRQRIRQRQDLFAKHGSDVLQALPGSELACKELMEMCIQFLCARYPEHFRLEGHVLVNELLGTKHDLSTTEPLHVVLNNIPEDFALILRDEKTGRYIFRAGIICSAVGWNVKEKIGLEMGDIHKPVPDFKEKLAFSLDRFFTKMPIDTPIQRGSWGLEVGEPLYLPSDDPAFASREHQDPGLRPQDVNLRVDWQTLRRLPLSGSIVFNFKALFTPMAEFRNEPYIPSLLYKVLTEGKENLLKYKGTYHIEHVAVPAFREYIQYQEDSGMIEKDWEPQTLGESPFYPGWQKRWTQSGA